MNKFKHKPGFSEKGEAFRLLTKSFENFSFLLFGLFKVLLTVCVGLIYCLSVVLIWLFKVLRQFGYGSRRFWQTKFSPWLKQVFWPELKKRWPSVAKSATRLSLATVQGFALVWKYSRRLLKDDPVAKKAATSEPLKRNRGKNIKTVKVQIKSRGKLINWLEARQFALWLIKPAVKNQPSTKIKTASSAFSIRDFKRLLREPKHVLLRKAVAVWMIFLLVLSTLGVASLTPLFDWLFGKPQSLYAATFTGKIKVSKQSTNLSANGNWYTALAYSGDGINGDAEAGTFNPIHAGGTTDSSAGGLAVGYVFSGANATYSADQYIGFKPNTDANLAGVQLVFENQTATSLNNVDLQVELLHYPTATCTTSCSNYVTGTQGSYTYPNNTVVLRRSVWQYNKALSSENLTPGNFGRATLDFRFDNPVAVTSTLNYGIRITNYGPGAPVFGAWAGGTPTTGFAKVNGPIRTIGVDDIDLLAAPTVEMPLALTGNTVLTTSGMVAVNSVAGLGLPTVKRTQNEHWSAVYAAGTNKWTMTGSVSGVQTNTLTATTTGAAGPSWVNDGVPITVLTADSAVSPKICVSSITNFAVNQTVNIWDADTATASFTILSTDGEDETCPNNSPSITATANFTAGFTVSKFATIAQAIWKQRIIQGAIQDLQMDGAANAVICVEDNSKFAAGGTVAIWDDDTAIVSRTISSFAGSCAQGQPITVNSSVPVTYTTAAHAKVAEVSATLVTDSQPADGAVMRWTSFNHTQNPLNSTYLSRTLSAGLVLAYAKNEALATSNVRYPFLSNRHIFFVAYGDGETTAPVDGDVVVVGNGKSNSDTSDSPNLENDLTWQEKETHVVNIDRNWDAAMAYTGYNGAVGDGAGGRTDYTYTQNSGFISAMILPGSQLGLANPEKTHYRINIPGKILLDSDSSLAFGKAGAATPASSYNDIYFDNVSPAVSTNLTVDAAASANITVASTAGFYPGDNIVLDDSDSPALSRTIAAVESATVLKLSANATVDYTLSKGAFVAKGPTTELPTGMDRRAGVYTMTGTVGTTQTNQRTGRVSLYAEGSDDFRTMKSDLAVDIDGNVDTGYLGNNSTDAGNTWVDVKDDVVGDWQPLDQIAVAGGTNQAVDNNFSTLGMGANDDASAVPTWTGGTTAGGRNALPTPNMEVAEIGTVPLTDIYNADYYGGSVAFSSNYATNTAWTLFGDGANTEIGDAVYFGDRGDNPTYSLEFNLGQALSADNTTILWEYWNGLAWTAFTPRDAYTYQTRVGYTLPLSANTTRGALTLTVAQGGANFLLDQIVMIDDDDSPPIYMRLGTTAPTATTLTLANPMPGDLYTTNQNATVSRLNGGQWRSIDPATILTGTGRRMLSWTPFDLGGVPAKTTVNGHLGYWVRAKIDQIGTWNASPINQQTPVGMSGIERLGSSYFNVSSGVQEAKLGNITAGAAFDANEQWVLEYGNSPGWTQNNMYTNTTMAVPSAPYIWDINAGGTLNIRENNLRHEVVSNGDFSWTDYTLKGLVYMDQTVGASTHRLGLLGRLDADGNGYGILMTKTAATVSFQIWTVVDGVPTTGLGTPKTVDGFNVDTWYCFKGEFSGTSLSAEYWPTTDCESGDPGHWDTTATDATYTHGRLGVYAGSANNSVGTQSKFDNITTSTGFSDTFTDTGTWRVSGSSQGFIGTASPSVPFTSNYLNFTIKHKGGWSGTVTPKIGDKIFISATAGRSYKGLSGLTVGNNAKYEVWRFEWNPLAGAYNATGSSSGDGGLATPGSSWTAPQSRLALTLGSGVPTGPKFGARMLNLQDNLLRNNGSWVGTNGISSAVLINPSLTLTGSSITPRVNIEGISGTATSRLNGAIDFWFKTNYNGAPSSLISPKGMYLFDWANQLDTNRIFIRHTPDGYLEASVFGGTTQGAILSKQFLPTAGEWHHFRLDWVSDGVKRAWLDGVPFEAGGGQGSAVAARAANAGLIRLGNRWLYDAGFDGAIDEFAIFDNPIDTSSSCDWGDFSASLATSTPWTGGGTAGCGVNTGVNLFKASFDTAMNPKEGFVWADYAFGNPAMIFTNGADTGNETFKVITYPQRTRIWIDNTGEKYTPSARIKFGSGFQENTTLAALAGWSHNFTFHHMAKRDSVDAPTFSPVLNLRRSTHIWSDEIITAASGNPAAANIVNNGLGLVGTVGVGLSGLATINLNNVSMENQYAGMFINGNPYTSVTPYPTQTVDDCVFYNYFDRAYSVSGKTQGRNTVGAYFVTTHIGAANIGAGYNAGTSQNVGIDGSVFMGHRNAYVTAPPAAAGGAATFYSGRIYFVNNSEFYNNGVTGAGTSGALNFGVGVAKVDIGNNIFSVNTNGIRLYSNSFFNLTNNVFDGGVGDNATTVGADYGAGIRSAQSYSSVAINDSGSIFGRGQWNEADISLPPNTTTFEAESFLQFIGDRTQFLSPMLFATQDYANCSRVSDQYMLSTIPGTEIRFNLSSNAKDIINATTYGNMRTTGTGLTDTSAHTSGGYSWRLESRSSDAALEYSAKLVGVANEPLAVTGYLMVNSDYGATNLPTVTMSGLGMSGNGLTWTAANTPGVWQQFTVYGTPTESALATVKISSQSDFVAADSGVSEMINNAVGNYLPVMVEDFDKTWTPNQWVGYLFQDVYGRIFEIVKNNSTILYLKGTVVPHLKSTTLTAGTMGDYKIFRPPYVYVDDMSVLSGTVDTGTLDFHSDGQPVSPWLSTGLTASGVWGAQANLFTENAGSFGQIISDKLAVKRGLVSDANPSTTVFDTNITEAASNFYQNQILVFMSGQNEGVARKISSYNGSTKEITLDVALPYAPAMNDEFTILSQYSSGSGGGATAAEVWAYATRRLSDATLSGGGSIATLNDLNNLSLISAADVWNYGSKTLTGGVSLSNPEQVWNIAKTLLTGEGTIGKLVADNLDVAVSTRGLSNLTAADVWSASGKAIDSIEDGGLQAIAANVWSYQTKELTSGDLTAERVWNTLLTSINTTNSVGKLLKDNIDINLSSRAAATDLADLATNVSTANAKLDNLIGSLISAQASVADPTPSNTAFITNLSKTDNDFYKNGVIVFNTGLNSGQVRRISAYNGSTKQLTVTPALTVAPANGDSFTILAQTSESALDASAVWNYASRNLTDAQLDSGSLTTLGNLQTTEASLTSAVTAAKKAIQGVIVNQETAVKSGNALTIMFKSDSGLTGDNRPLLNVYGPAGTAVASDLAMEEVGTTGVYKYALTFETAWGTGQFIIQATDDYNHTGDSLNLSVKSTDIETIGTDVAGIKIDVAEIKVDIASIKSRLDNIDTAIEALDETVALNISSGSGAGNTTTISHVYSVTSPDIMTQMAAYNRRVEDLLGKINPSDTANQLTTIAASIADVNKALGKFAPQSFDQVLTISKDLSSKQTASIEDLTYIKNKIADFKAVTGMQRQVSETSSSTVQPIVTSWLTSGSVDVNIMVTNPAKARQKIPVKVYLPKEAKLEHVMETGGLKIEFDVQLDTLYATGEFELDPGETLKKTVELRDIWQISEDDLKASASQSDQLFKQLAKTPSSAQALLLKNDIDNRISKIIRTQKENTASPQDKIMTFRENQDSYTSVKQSLEELKNMTTQNASSRSMLGAFGGVQTMVVWGVVIAFVTGFGLLVVILFTMWRHQMQVANNQLAWQAEVMAGAPVHQALLKSAVLKKSSKLSKKSAVLIENKLDSPLSGWLAWLNKNKLRIVVAVVGAILVLLAVRLVNYYWPQSDTSEAATIESDASDAAIAGENLTEQGVISSTLAIDELKELPPLAQNNNDTSAATKIVESGTSQTPIKFVMINTTPTGYLNVRAAPLASAPIIAKVVPGDTLELIMTQPPVEGGFGWHQIKLPNGSSGWVSQQYATVK